MDDQSRLAIHQAVHHGPSTEAQPTIDVYQREARALLVPGLARKYVANRVSGRMGLKAASSGDGNVQLWYIVQSNVYSGLEVTYSAGALVSWVLLPINGPGSV